MSLVISKKLLFNKRIEYRLSLVVFKKVQVGNDQEKAQSEKKNQKKIPTPKTEAGKNKLTIRY